MLLLIKFTKIIYTNGNLVFKLYYLIYINLQKITILNVKYI